MSTQKESEIDRINTALTYERLLTVAAEARLRGDSKTRRLAAAILRTVARPGPLKEEVAVHRAIVSAAGLPIDRARAIIGEAVASISPATVPPRRLALHRRRVALRVERAFGTSFFGRVVANAALARASRALVDSRLRREGLLHEAARRVDLVEAVARRLAELPVKQSSDVLRTAYDIGRERFRRVASQLTESQRRVLRAVVAGELSGDAADLRAVVSEQLDRARAAALLVDGGADVAVRLREAVDLIGSTAPDDVDAAMAAAEFVDSTVGAR